MASPTDAEGDITDIVIDEVPNDTRTSTLVTFPGNITSAVDVKTDIIRKTITLAVTLITIVFALYLLRNESKYRSISLAMAITFTFFYIPWLRLLFKSKYLHHIIIITTRLAPDFGDIIFPVKIERYPTKPIKSMSELFALRGVDIHAMFLSMALIIGVLMSSAVVGHWMNLHQYANIDTFWDIEYIELFLTICSGLATVLIGLFDLNPNDNMHCILHYTGVIFMMISVFPYALQSNFNALSIILMIGSFGSWTVWFIVSYYYPDDVSMDDGGNDKEDARQLVHGISLKCVVIETIGCIFASVCNVAYVWNLGDVERDYVH